MPEERRVLVQGVNMVKRHTRPSTAQPGGIIDKEAAIHISNVAHDRPEVATSRPASASSTSKDGRKVRVARRSGEMIDR